MQIEASPLYLDTSALAKIYVQEADSDALDAALTGRRDLLISELALTELTSALARRVREKQVDATVGRRIYQQLLRDVRTGEYRLLDLTSAIADARALVTYDRQMHAAALALGAFEVVPALLAPTR